MEDDIFRQASKTYYWSTTFFPNKAKAEVMKLYTFVRVADDFVDVVPQDPESFFELKHAFYGEKPAKNVKISLAIEHIEYLIKKYDFDRKWPEAFLAAMESDLSETQRDTIEDSIEYIYGSAAVIGLMMARILGLDSRDNFALMHFESEQGSSEDWTESYNEYEEGEPEPTNKAQSKKHHIKVSFADFQRDVMHSAKKQGMANAMDKLYQRHRRRK